MVDGGEYFQIRLTWGNLNESWRMRGIARIVGLLVVRSELFVVGIRFGPVDGKRIELINTIT